MTDGPFYVQCISGKSQHIVTAVSGSALEAKCKMRLEEGYIDALCLYYDECPECIYERQAKDLMDYQVLGCPEQDMRGNCAEDCSSCKSRLEVPSSIYDGQTQRVSPLVFADA